VNERVRLSDLLNRVRETISGSFRISVWTLVEVSRVTTKAGHWYLQLCERDQSGTFLAQAEATIWRNVAESIIPDFTRSTGMQLAHGVKLLVRARPEFHARYGFRLNIDAIDPSYTIGELEAKRRHIRARLKAEGLYDANRRLQPVWDYFRVLVLAPHNAAGLGDFQVEASRLEQHGLCTFTYVHSRFQGDGAPSEIIAALGSALETWPRRERDKPPDAVVIIRGGGSANDLAWLDDYDLARAICTCPVPVLTGIGHERDSTLVDEVAHRRYDTPSKVIAAIEQHIRQRAADAEAAFQELGARVREITTAAHRRAEAARNNLLEASVRHLETSQRRSYQLYSDVNHRARAGLRESSHLAVTAYTDIRVATQAKVASMAACLPTLFSQVGSGATRKLSAASEASRKAMADVQLHATRTLHTTRIGTQTTLTTLLLEARRSASAISQRLPALLSHVTVSVRQALGDARSATERDIEHVKGSASRASEEYREDVARSFSSITHDAYRILQQSSIAGETLMREIVAQGPDKTLRRGFVVVRTPTGHPVTTAAAARTQDNVDLQFLDGAVNAQINNEA
jgi:exodeoxyribonuclease VII large subunit